VRVGSPCIDAGDNRQVPKDKADINEDDDLDERLPLDLAGNMRFVNDPVTADTGIADFPLYHAIIDMGAYENAGGVR
jgi:hypothetical protein